jgi:hypothetical protein
MRRIIDYTKNFDKIKIDENPSLFDLDITVDFDRRV